MAQKQEEAPVVSREAIAEKPIGKERVRDEQELINKAVVAATEKEYQTAMRRYTEGVLAWQRGELSEPPKLPVRGWNWMHAERMKVLRAIKRFVLVDTPDGKPVTIGDTLIPCGEFIEITEDVVEHLKEEHKKRNCTAIIRPLGWKPKGA